MLNRMKRCVILCFFFTLLSCHDECDHVNSDPEIYLVEYTIDYVNTTDFNYELSQGYFEFPDNSGNGVLLNPVFYATLEKNSNGSFSIIWVYTVHYYAREPFMDRGNSINSFYLKLHTSQDNDCIIAGWPESVYSATGIISYGHGWGFGRSSVGVIQEEKLMKFVFDDVQPPIRKEKLKARASLYINNIEDIVFQLTEFPQLDFFE